MIFCIFGLIDLVEGRMGSWNEQQRGESLLSRIKRKNYQQLIFLKNRPPQWNAQLNCYVLNFKGRVTMASVKNFQLVKPTLENDVILQVRTRYYCSYVS